MIATAIEKTSLKRTVIDGGRCDKYCTAYDGVCKDFVCSSLVSIGDFIGEKYTYKKEQCKKVEITCKIFDK